MPSNLSPKEIVGSNILRARRAKGLSGSDLADLLLCSQQHVSRIERGVIRLHLEQIQQIASSLDVDINYLLDGVGFQNSSINYIHNMECYFKSEGLFSLSSQCLK
ncbi:MULTISPECIES: helix-turn-helix domain-containing protein [Providencia]|uniref:helix-turn-helix domain-containing protein n=1 Tax=Providencia TaxID=586 RepID=UPI0019823DF6|nr:MULTISPECIES: helix-turn-helix transcriptional regulator [Providencia]HEC8326932.1 helix-turn-helix transcriptional regulator [Providencia rettgeri]MBN4864767.1 helix-turn-helix transcriptional regulator [Providencia stuartii]MBN4873787.1 helix-turn-helix transcriptional regulator [Providencia stuartii]MBN4878478.1 helix-turn-helix transcriptional regulator [Providencia stuartii]MBN4883289.1 helix-turn-helix transcriptional regulator [Providencia stuartii]